MTCRSISDFVEQLGVRYDGAANNLADLVAQDVEEDAGKLPEADPVPGRGGGVGGGVSGARLLTPVQKSRASRNTLPLAHILSSYGGLRS